MSDDAQNNAGCLPGCVCIMMLFLSVLLITTGIDFINDTDMLNEGLIFIVIGALIPIILIIIFILHRNKIARDNQERINKEKEAERIKREQFTAACVKCKKEEEALISKYGNPNKIIRLETTDINRYIMVFGEKKLLFVNGVLVNFSSILSYNIVDDYSIAKGTVFATTSTKTNVGETVSLGVVGAIVGGDAGAIVGSSMAAKDSTTIISGGEDKIQHNYILTINVKDINNPLIKFVIGEDTDISMEINAIMLYIVDGNK